MCSQLYPHWQLCIADDASSAPHVREIIRFFASKDPRIVSVWRADNGGIAAATNDALASVTGQYVAFMDHDDTLAKHALLAIAIKLKNHAQLQLVYSDSDRLDATGHRSKPFFKPGWNYELFLAQNYLNHLSVCRKSLLDKVGGLNPDFDGAQDYDLVLRAVEQLQASEIGHIPHILYHWRVVESSVSRSKLGDAVRAGRNAVRAHLVRSSFPATIEPVGGARIYNRIIWDLPEPQPAVAILVYGEDPESLCASAQELQNRTRYRRVVIETVCCVADMNNVCGILNTVAGRQKADIICFVAAGLVPLADNWLDILAAHAARLSVGAVGVKFISNHSIVACGPLVLGVEDPRGGGLFGLAFDGATKESKGDFARFLLEQEVSAIHGACFACRRDVFQCVGGLKSVFATRALIGVDYSLKVAELGCRIIWAADVMFNCSNAVADAVFEVNPSVSELEILRNDWSQRLTYDPFYNPNFANHKACFSLPQA